MISRDDVVAAFRLLLGREPESETVVAHYAAEVKDLRELRELFVNSVEFREKNQDSQPPRPPRPPVSTHALAGECGPGQAAVGVDATGAGAAGAKFFVFVRVRFQFLPRAQESVCCAGGLQSRLSCRR